MTGSLVKVRALRLAPTAAAFAALFALMLFSGAAVAGAREGLSVCISVIVPSLLPFFVVSGLLSELGAPQLLGRLATPVTSRLFGVSGVGATAFILGLSGGYPLGAATVCDLYTRGDLDRKEAERLLGFCNNSGPAFILGAAGAGVFQSSAVGIMLYVSHALAAVILGMVTRRAGGREPPSAGIVLRAKKFSSAFPDSIKRAGASCGVICSFVVFFAALMGVLRATGLINAAAGCLSAATGVEMGYVVSFVTGFLEMGSGIASLSGFPQNAANLALCSFIVGFGGLSVYCQSMALTVPAGLRAASLLPMKLAHGTLAALISAIAWRVLC